MLKLKAIHVFIKSTAWIIALAVGLLGSQSASAGECGCMVKQISKDGRGWDFRIKCMEGDLKGRPSCADVCANSELKDFGGNKMDREVLHSYTTIVTDNATKYGAADQCSDELMKLYVNLKMK